MYKWNISTGKYLKVNVLATLMPSMKKITIALVSVFVLTFSIGAAFAQAYGTIAGCTNLTRDLAYRSRGAEVKQLQAFLIDQNYPGSGDWMVTGFFGRATGAALRVFQQQNGLTQSGVVDASVRDAIYHISCDDTSYGLNYNNYNIYNPYSYTATPYTYDYNYAYPYTTNTYPYTTNTYPYNTYPCDTSYSYASYNSGYQNNCGYNQYPYNNLTSISSLSASSGAVGSSITIFGRGFSTNGNVVHFGQGTITGLSSIDGTSITFTVPTSFSGYGYESIGLGVYNISVTNASGYTTATIPFTITSTGTTGINGNPWISYLSKTAGPVGTSVTIYGGNFSLVGNTVRFGNGAITNISANGSSIIFTIPSSLSPYCVGGVACPMYAQTVTPGAYPVSVINGNGSVSNTVIFIVQ